MELGLIAANGCGAAVGFILWLVAAALVIWGIVTAIRGALVQGIVLIVIGLIIGPGGFSLFC